MKLLKLSKTIYTPFEKMAKDYYSHDEWHYYYKYEEGVEDIEKYIQRLGEIENNIDLEENSPPFSQYFLLDDNLSEIRGIIRIRHINDSIHGNIGYDVPPTMRLKGYGKKLLELGIQIAISELNIKDIFVSCNKDNEGSRKVILANNGVLIDTVYDEEEEEFIERYAISQI